jgi:hypothetical protein
MAQHQQGTLCLISAKLPNVVLAHLHKGGVLRVHGNAIQNVLPVRFGHSQIQGECDLIAIGNRVMDLVEYHRCDAMGKYIKQKKISNRIDQIKSKNE